MNVRCWAIPSFAMLGWSYEVHVSLVEERQRQPRFETTMRWLTRPLLELFGLAPFQPIDSLTFQGIVQ